MDIMAHLQSCISPFVFPEDFMNFLLLLLPLLNRKAQEIYTDCRCFLALVEFMQYIGPCGRKSDTVS